MKENVLGGGRYYAMLGVRGGVRGLASGCLTSRRAPAARYDTRMLGDPGCKFSSLHTCVHRSLITGSVLCPPLAVVLAYFRLLPDGVPSAAASFLTPLKVPT